MFVTVLMFLIGAYAVTGIFQPMTPTLWLVALVIVLVVRPAAGLIGLVGTGLPRRERWIIAFFGIRGIGSIYYLAYAVSRYGCKLDTLKARVWTTSQSCPGSYSDEPGAP